MAKCRCEPRLQPVLPTRRMIDPTDTRCPTRTPTRERCRSQLDRPLPWSSPTAMPLHASTQPAAMTVPVAAALTGSPVLPSMSMPLWMPYLVRRWPQSWVIGPRRGRGERSPGGEPPGGREDEHRVVLGPAEAAARQVQAAHPQRCLGRGMVHRLRETDAERRVGTDLEGSVEGAEADDPGVGRGLRL